MAYLPILTYHRIIKEEPTKAVDPKRIAVSAAQFRSHMTFLKRLGYHSVSLNTYGRQLRENPRIPARSFAITFDDAYQEMVTLALPVLRDTGFAATVFAVSGQLGGTNAWDDGQAALLTADGLRAWRQAKMDVGAHTCSHVHLPQVDAAAARHEIVDSKKQLEEVLGETVSTFAYPYGETNEVVSGLVRDAGFDAAFVTDRGRRNHAENLYHLRRVVIFPRTNLWELLWKVQRWYPAYQDWKRRP